MNAIQCWVIYAGTFIGRFSAPCPMDLIYLHGRVAQQNAQYRTIQIHLSGDEEMADPAQDTSQAAQAAQLIPAWVEWVSKLATPLIALIAAGYTALQYKQTRKWRAKDLAARLVDQLSTDDELAFACQALDWGVGPMVVPARYRPLLFRSPADPDNPTSEERGEIMGHDPAAFMAKALEGTLAPGLKDQPAGLIYRYCFDKLFSHLANINRLRMDGQVKIKDLDSLKYWIRKIADYRYGPKERRGGLDVPAVCGIRAIRLSRSERARQEAGCRGLASKAPAAPQ